MPSTHARSLACWLTHPFPITRIGGLIVTLAGAIMPAKKHDRETILETIRNQAKRLGKNTLTKQDVQSVISSSTVVRYFGTVGNALEAAGLQRSSVRDHLNVVRPGAFSDADLFRSILAVEESLGRVPNFNEYISSGSYSAKPFKRFGKWSDALVYYEKWKAEGGTNGEAPPERNSSRVVPTFQTHISPAQLYGEPIDFRGLRHAPINEQGVVYVFGMVSRELGFYIEAIQQGFPDCEGKYLHDAKKNLWAKARIELEFRASSFREHGHNADQCDFIVCWINDWPDCPLRVIELSKEILRLPNR